MARTHACDHCGHVFTDTRSLSQARRFCSRTCHLNALQILNTKYPATIEVVCGFCRQSFQASHKKVRQGKGLFCSAHCRAKIAARQPIEERFWSRVNKLEGPDACWLWTGAPTTYGYGMLSIHGTQVRVHRLSYAWHKGPIVDGLFVCHKCPTGENRLCVNPDHLYLGTAQDNVADKVRAGRQAHLAKKFTVPDIHAIRYMHTCGLSMCAIARHYKASHRTIGAIIDRRTWKHIA